MIHGWNRVIHRWKHVIHRWKWMIHHWKSLFHRWSRVIQRWNQRKGRRRSSVACRLGRFHHRRTARFTSARRPELQDENGNWREWSG
jgi:hypothetical protein